MSKKHTQKGGKKNKKSGIGKKLAIIFGSVVLVGAAAAGVAIPLVLKKPAKPKQLEGLNINTPVFGNTIQGYYYVVNGDINLIKLTADLSDDYKEKEIVWDKTSGDDNIHVNNNGSITWGAFYDENTSDYPFTVRAYLKDDTDVWDSINLSLHLNSSHLGITTQFGTDGNVFSRYDTPSNNVNQLQLKADFIPSSEFTNSLSETPKINWAIPVDSISPADLKDKIVLDADKGLVSWRAVSADELSGARTISFDVTASLQGASSITVTKKFTLTFGNPIPYPIEYGGVADSWFDITDEGVLTGTNSNWDTSNLKNYDTLFIPSGVKQIADNSFFDGTTGKILTENVPKGIQIVFGAGSQCTTISNTSFTKCTGINGTVKFPENLSEVNYSSSSNGGLLNGTNVENVDFSKCKIIDYIPIFCCQNCSKLKTIEFPLNLKTLDRECFENCTELTSISLPAPYISATMNHTYAKSPFFGCTKLASIDVSKCSEIQKFPAYPNDVDNSCFGIQDLSGAEIYYDKDFKTCLGFDSNYSGSKITIPTLTLNPNVRSIQNESFKPIDKFTINSIDLSNCTKLKRIGDECFEGFTTLSQVKLPDSLEYLGPDVFQNSVIVTFDISNCNKLERYYLNSLCSCQTLKELKFPKSLKEFLQYAGAPLNAKNLEKINFEDLENLRAFDLYPFYGCTKINSIDLSNSKRLVHCSSHGIGDGTGYPLSAMYEQNGVYYDKSRTVFFGAINSTKLPSGSISLDEKTKIISQYSRDHFNNNVTSFDCSAASNLKVVQSGWTLSGPAGRQTVGLDNVDGLYYDKSHTVCFGSAATSITSYNFLPSTKYIDAQALYNCSTLESNLTLPDGLISIGDKAFYNCEKLTGDINIPDTVEYIGDQAFYLCKGFDGQLHLPNNENFTTIGTQAFYKCDKLSGNLTIPNGVKEIDNKAFYECSNFSSIALSNSIETIGDQAFYGCTNMSGNLIFTNKLTSLGESSFYGCTKISSVSMIDSNQLVEIPTTCFSFCSALQSISLPESIRRIGASAFFEDTVNEINLPWNKTTLDNDEVAGIWNLPNVSLNATIIIDSSMSKAAYYNIFRQYSLATYGYASITWLTR